MKKSLLPIQKAYLAGFLDGDGSIYVRAKPNPTYRFGFQVAPYIVFFQSQKDQKNFSLVCNRIGYGKMRIRKDGIIEYAVTKIDEVKVFLKLISPFLILKKKQAELMFKIIEHKEKAETASDFQKLLKLIDLYRTLNYSKKRKLRTLTP